MIHMEYLPASELKVGDLFTTSGLLLKQEFEEAKQSQITVLVKTALPFSEFYGKQMVFRVTFVK